MILVNQKNFTTNSVRVTGTYSKWPMQSGLVGQSINQIERFSVQTQLSALLGLGT